MKKLIDLLSFTSDTDKGLSALRYLKNINERKALQINEVDIRGNTPLTLCAQKISISKNYLLIAQKIIEHGADINYKGGLGSCLTLCTMRQKPHANNDKLIELLLARGASLMGKEVESLVRLSNIEHRNLWPAMLVRLQSEDSDYRSRVIKKLSPEFSQLYNTHKEKTLLEKVLHTEAKPCSLVKI